MRSAIEMITFKVRFIVEPDGDSYYGYCPELKGLHVSGESEQEAVSMLKESAKDYLQSLLKHNDPIPLGLVHKRRRISLQGIIRDIKNYLFPKERHCHIEELTV